MLTHVVRALEPVVDEVLAVGPAAGGPVPALPDAGTPHRGPLAGIVAAAEAHPASLLAVVAVDQPWVRSETIEHLLAVGGPLPVVPVHAGIRQTTCAVYPAEALDGAKEELEGGGSIQSLLDQISFHPVVESEWRAWHEDGRSWFSADSVTDISEGVRRYGEP